MSTATLTPTISSIDMYIGYVIVALLTLFISTITMVLTNYSSERQRKKEKQLDTKQRIAEQTFSPLFFYLFEMVTPLGNLKGLFLAAISVNLENIKPNQFIAMIKEYRERLNCNRLKDLLDNNFCSIQPHELRLDILNFYILLNQLNTRLAKISEDDFYDTGNLIQKLKNYYTIIDVIAKFNGYFVNIIDSQIFQSNIDVCKLKYKRRLPNELTKTVLDLFLANTEDKKLMEQIEREAQELLKEAGNVSLLQD